VEWETKAIKLTTDKGLQSELTATLKLYQQHKPFRLGHEQSPVVQTSARKPFRSRTTKAADR
jgi:hypothetical protein